MNVDAPQWLASAGMPANAFVGARAKVAARLANDSTP